MPYTETDYPDVIAALPKDARSIWIAAYNAALEQYEDEALAAATAWAVIEKVGYRKTADGRWTKQGSIRQTIRHWLMRDSDADESESSEEMTRAGGGGVMVLRDAEGRYRWLAVAASAVRNRVGEIDSTALYQDFVRRAQQHGAYPFLDFAHWGKLLVLGRADWLAVDDMLYLASGTFADTPMARAAAETLVRDGDNWGTSIAYVPVHHYLDEEIGTRVYDRGVNVYISIVPRDSAANYFTALFAQCQKGGDLEMDERMLEQLRQLVGDELAQQFSAFVGGIKRAVTDAGLITRDTVADAPAVAEAGVVARDDAAVSADVGTDGGAVANTPEDGSAAVLQAVTELGQRIEALGAVVLQIAERLSGIERAVVALADAATPDSGTQVSAERRQLDDDNTAPAVTYRPRVQGVAENTAPDAQEIAASTLAVLRR